MNSHGWYLIFVTMIAAWQESGENPAVFCYLMMWGTAAVVWDRLRALSPAFVRLETACSKPSVIFFTRSTIPTNSPN